MLPWLSVIFLSFFLFFWVVFHVTYLCQRVSACRQTFIQLCSVGRTALAFEAIEYKHRYSCCIQRRRPSLQNQRYPLVPVENTFILNGLISHIVNWVLFRPASKLIIIVYLLPCYAKKKKKKKEDLTGAKCCSPVRFWVSKRNCVWCPKNS